MRARLLVSRELAGSERFRLPPGYERGEERFLPIGEMIEMEVRGPFAPGLPEFVEETWPNGSYFRGPPKVEAHLGQWIDHLEWQWVYEGRKLGAPISMPLPAVATA